MDDLLLNKWTALNPTIGQIHWADARRGISPLKQLGGFSLSSGRWAGSYGSKAPFELLAFATPTASEQRTHDQPGLNGFTDQVGFDAALGRDRLTC